MKIADLMDLLRSHLDTPERCARELLNWTTGQSREELTTAFRTARALGCLDSQSGRRLLVALERLPSSSAAQSPELDSLREDVEDLEAKLALQAEKQTRADELQRRIDELEDQLQLLEASAVRLAGEIEACTGRSELMRQGLAEVESNVA